MPGIRSRGRNAGRPRRRMSTTIRVLIILLSILLLLTVIATGAALLVQHSSQREYEQYQFDTDAMLGRIQTMTEEEIQQELNRVVEEGMFNISIASAIVFDGPQGEGEARIENVESNRYHMKVDIRLDSTGELVYSSKLIRPGYSIQNIRLNRELEPGEYEATATFSAITQQEMELFGQAGAQIKLYVMDENGRVPQPAP